MEFGKKINPISEGCNSHKNAFCIISSLFFQGSLAGRIPRVCKSVLHVLVIEKLYLLCTLLFENLQSFYINKQLYHTLHEREYLKNHNRRTFGFLL